MKVDPEVRELASALIAQVAARRQHMASLDDYGGEQDQELSMLAEQLGDATGDPMLPGDEPLPLAQVVGSIRDLLGQMPGGDEELDVVRSRFQELDRAITNGAS